MLIDWFTVAAQALNFLVLVWLLQHFLYKPILSAIDTREKRIAAELADADTKRAEAQKERSAFEQKNEAFDRERAAMLDKATDEAKAERRRLLDEARSESEALRTKRQRALRDEAHNLNDTIRRRTQTEVLAIARKALAELASTSVEARITDVFIARLRALDSDARTMLAKALQTGPTAPLVRSAFDLPAEQQVALQTAFNETLATSVKIRFETVPALVAGIELSTNGEKVAWSIADFLGTLEDGLNDLLQETSKPSPKVAALAVTSTSPGTVAPMSAAQHQ